MTTLPSFEKLLSSLGLEEDDASRGQLKRPRSSHSSTGEPQLLAHRSSALQLRRDSSSSLSTTSFNSSRRLSPTSPPARALARASTNTKRYSPYANPHDLPPNADARADSLPSIASQKQLVAPLRAFASDSSTWITDSRPRSGSLPVFAETAFLTSPPPSASMASSSSYASSEVTTPNSVSSFQSQTPNYRHPPASAPAFGPNAGKFRGKLPPIMADEDTMSEDEDSRRAQRSGGRGGGGSVALARNLRNRQGSQAVDPSAHDHTVRTEVNADRSQDIAPRVASSNVRASPPKGGVSPRKRQLAPRRNLSITVTPAEGSRAEAVASHEGPASATKDPASVKLRAPPQSAPSGTVHHPIAPRWPLADHHLRQRAPVLISSALRNTYSTGSPSSSPTVDSTSHQEQRAPMAGSSSIAPPSSDAGVAMVVTSPIPTPSSARSFGPIGIPQLPAVLSPASATFGSGVPSQHTKISRQRRLTAQNAPYARDYQHRPHMSASGSVGGGGAAAAAAASRSPRSMPGTPMAIPLLPPSVSVGDNSRQVDTESEGNLAPVFISLANRKRGAPEDHRNGGLVGKTIPPDRRPRSSSHQPTDDGATTVRRMRKYQSSASLRTSPRSSSRASSRNRTLDISVPSLPQFGIGTRQNTMSTESSPGTLAKTTSLSSQSSFSLSGELPGAMEIDDNAQRRPPSMIKVEEDEFDELDPDQYEDSRPASTKNEAEEMDLN